MFTYKCYVNILLQQKKDHIRFRNTASLSPIPTVMRPLCLQDEDTTSSF